jgi:signal peptidase I
VSSVRRITETIALVICLVMFVRCVVIEPFGVPTGSMAMTMLGNHKACDCPRCGYRVTVGSSCKTPDDRRGFDRAYHGAWCPNCGCSQLPLADVPETTGDRLLVDKTAFEYRKPRRWEVAVFRNPSDWSKPYVKRVVGLPNERIQIRDGDVYVNDQLCRKTFAELRPLRVLVFDQSCQPPQTWRQRWVSGHLAGISALFEDRHLSPLSEIPHGSDLFWPASSVTAEERWLTYRHWLLDEEREEVIRDWFAYNGGAVRHELSEVHDFAAAFQVEAAAGGGVLSLMMTDGRSLVQIELPIRDANQSEPGFTVRGVPPPERLLRPPMLSPRQRHQIEIAFVDRRISLAIDGQEVFSPIDLPADGMRRGVSRPISLGARGPAVTIREFRLYRDVHYTQSGRNGIFDAWPLGSDEYFVLGDNSSNSEDSRHWLRPGVPFDFFVGRPLLLHQPSRWSQWGQWQLQSLDWQRIRWVR